ncbi:MAG TPA: DUF305 domain-containing protein [Gemmatimonadaceae bacterium]|nr:DUF305 domain-containing protein [Gemmatimonadaceae bacterium]
MVATLAACAGRRTHSSESGPRPSAMMGDEAAVARAKADSARYPYTEADVRFMSTMISHHAQAIAMARLSETNGANPAIRRLSDRIINAQTDEIGLMGGWLRARHRPVPEANPAGMKMTMNGMEHVMLMPGMLTDAQMAQLRAARDGEFDRLFLTFMIQHHRGAVEMVNELLGHRGAAQDETVFKFASDVHVDQTTEITRMLQMLLALGGAASPVQ